jgi:capsular polysaccharide transport system ATP-binding protein
MIILDQLTKSIGPFFNKRHVVCSVSIQIPTERKIALVSQAEADKKIFIDLLAGLVKPTSGTISRLAHVSFPVGQLPGFAREHSVRLNVAYAARLYGAEVAGTVSVVEEVMDMGRAFDRPYADMPNKLRHPLAQAVAFALPFDLYLLTDDSLGRSCAEGKKRRRSPLTAQLLFEARAKTSGMIIPTRNIEYAREICDMALVLKGGTLELFNDVDEAFDAARRDMTPNRKKRRRLDG